jgi:hypothetical protein
MADAYEFGSRGLMERGIKGKIVVESGGTGVEPAKR